MSARIYKYELEIVDHQVVDMPSGAKILTAQIQNNDRVYIWALVDPDRVKAKRSIRILGTGHPADGVSAHNYVGTVQKEIFKGGILMFHVFDRGEI